MRVVLRGVYADAGGRVGQPGQTVDLPDDVAIDLVASGQAESVDPPVRNARPATARTRRRS